MAVISEHTYTHTHYLSEILWKLIKGKFNLTKKIPDAMQASSYSLKSFKVCMRIQCPEFVTLFCLKQEKGDKVESVLK